MGVVLGGHFMHPILFMWVVLIVVSIPCKLIFGWGPIVMIGICLGYLATVVGFIVIECFRYKRVMRRLQEGWKSKQE